MSIYSLKEGKKKSRILFIRSGLNVEELGILYLSSALKKNGHETLLCLSDIEDVESVFKRYSPDFVCYSLVTGNENYFLTLNRKLKKSFDFKSVFGGPHCTFFPEIKYEDGVDYIIRGPGENALPSLVEGREIDQLGLQPLHEKLDDIPFPDRSLMYDKVPEFKNNLMKNIITIRGCPFDCTYCWNHSYKEMYKGELGKFLARRSVENVLAEIDNIRVNYPLEKILFIDDNFIVKKEWVIEFCETYRKECGLPFLCSLRVDLIDEDFIKLMVEAGLEYVNFALESSNPAVRKELLKRGNFSNEDVKNALYLFQKYGIRSRMQNFIGLPMDNAYEDARATLNFNRMYKATESWCAIFQPYPKTRLADYAIEKGYCDSEVVTKHSMKGYHTGSLLNLPNKDKINRLQKWWSFAIKFDISDELLDILLKIPLTQEEEDMLVKLRMEFSRKELYQLENTKNDNEALCYVIKDQNQSSKKIDVLLQKIISQNNYPPIIYSILSKLKNIEVVTGDLEALLR